MRGAPRERLTQEEVAAQVMLAGDLEPRFNGQQVHDAPRLYRQTEQLALPLLRIVTTSRFRGVSDSTPNYREAGSFAAFLIARFGLDRVLQFYRASAREGAVDVIESRFQQEMGTSLPAAEAD
jgi:hypothetical protein